MDREKVINGLRSIKTFFASQAIETTNDFVKLAFYESQKDIDDAIDLLKEQEAVEPTWRQGKAYCGSCGKRIPLKIGARFCHKCGRSVKWK